VTKVTKGTFNLIHIVVYRF